MAFVEIDYYRHDFETNPTDRWEMVWVGRMTINTNHIQSIEDCTGEGVGCVHLTLSTGDYYWLKGNAAALLRAWKA